MVQAEDELAAIGMAIGAGWSGLRSMTSTSGPGLSLMTEFAGLAYYAEVPIVVWDVQRIGPSTGLPTRTSQADLTFTHFMGHGDTQTIILLPGDVYECFEFGWRAFDIAEQLHSCICIERSRHGHEPVDEQADSNIPMSPWIVARSYGKGSRGAQRQLGRAILTRMAMAFLSAPCQGTGTHERLFHRAPVTMKMPVTRKLDHLGSDDGSFEEEILTGRSTCRRHPALHA